MNSPWNLSVPRGIVPIMELLTNVGAVVTGAVTVLVGLFSLATLLFDDIV